MRAFIFNSGRGSRLGALTAAQPKALVPLANGETLLSRQLRLLGKAGVGDVVISTGYLAEIDTPEDLAAVRNDLNNNPQL